MHIAKVQGAQDGDHVVITSDDDLKGCIGILSITPGWETVGIKMGCLHVRRNVGDVRPLSDRDRVVNP